MTCVCCIARLFVPVWLRKMPGGRGELSPARLALR